MSMPFSDEDIYTAVKNHLPSVVEYVKGHGGDIRLLGVKDGQVYIQLTGACHGCSMSLMTTKMVVEKRLKELIHPNLVVVNVEAGQENNLPEDLVRGAEGEEEDSEAKKEGLLKKIKKIF
ncbi:NifU family protein [Hydrogenimonas sp.]